jgi:hypothetical protein
MRTKLRIFKNLQEHGLYHVDKACREIIENKYSRQYVFIMQTRMTFSIPVHVAEKFQQVAWERKLNMSAEITKMIENRLVELSNKPTGD